LIALSFSFSAQAAQSGCANEDLEPAAGSTTALKNAVLCLLNEERAAKGEKPLKEDKKLLKAAKRHSLDMVKRRYFEHTSPDGESMKDRAVAADYVPKDRPWRVAENIAWGAGSYGSPRKIVAMWMKSAPHRRNILDGSLKHAGVGVGDGAPDGGEGATFTLVLGRR
jgi:uncharacterized protein YkwD